MKVNNWYKLSRKILFASTVIFAIPTVFQSANAQRVKDQSEIVGSWVSKSGETLTIDDRGNADSSQYGHVSVNVQIIRSGNVSYTGKTFACTFDVTLLPHDQSVWKLLSVDNECPPTGVFTRLPGSSAPSRSSTAFDPIDWLASHQFCYSSSPPATWRFYRRQGNEMATWAEVKPPGVPGIEQGTVQVKPLGGRRFRLMMNGVYFDYEAEPNDDMVLLDTNLPDPVPPAPPFPFRKKKIAC